MYRISDVSYAYSGGLAVLEGIDFSVNKGELLLLAGANGSGKSTLLALLAGLYDPTNGTIALEHGGDIRSSARLVMQDADLQILGGMVGEDLMLGREGQDEKRARSVAQRFNLAAHWDKPVQTLSWGMKRKLCLAGALLDEPEVLLLDEPFSGLDYPSALEMRSFLRESRTSGMTMVVTVHDLEPVIDLAHRMAVLDTGRLVLLDTPEKVLPHVGAHGIRTPCLWHRESIITGWDND